MYARGGVVGGGSAGLAIQGAVILRLRARPTTSTSKRTTPTRCVSAREAHQFYDRLVRWPALADTITDTHFVVRDRLGRMVVFLARIHPRRTSCPVANVYGLGIDQASAWRRSRRQRDRVQRPGGRGAYLVRGTPRRPHHRTKAVSLHGRGIARRAQRRAIRSSPQDDERRRGVRSRSTVAHGPFYSRDPYQP